MKKRKFGKPFSRSSGARKALYRSLVRAIVLNGEIITTQVKAKYVKRVFEKLVNQAKKGDLASKRMVNSKLGNDRVVFDKIYSEIVPMFGNKSGNYLKITYLPRRRGDGAKMAKIGWVKDTYDTRKSGVSKKQKKVKKTTKDSQKTKSKPVVAKISQRKKTKFAK